MPYASTADYNVQIVDNSGVPIVSFGGGTQYADGTAAATPTGTQVNFNEGGTQRSVSLTKPLPVQGILGNNAAAPGTTNVGALGALANAAAPAWTEGRQVLLSSDLTGNLRVLSSGALTNNNAAPAATNFGSLTALANAADPSWTEGRQVLASVTLAGYQRVTGMVHGLQAAGATIASNNPVLQGFLGTGTTVRYMTAGPSLNNTAGVDAPGFIQMVKDTTGGNYFPSLGDASGRQIAVGAGAAGSAIVGNPVLMAGSDATNARALLTDTSGRQIIVGAAASAGALAGNPVRIGASNGTNAYDLIVDSSTNPNLRVALYGGATAAVVSTLTDNDGGANMLFTLSRPQVYNGSTFDRLRCNQDLSLLTSAGRTTTQTSADITTHNCVGITLVLDMTVVGTGSVTVTINGKDANSAKYYNLLTGGAVITNSTNVYRIQPGLTAVATADVNARLPRIIQVVITANNANSATYSCSYCLHN